MWEGKSVIVKRVWSTKWEAVKKKPERLEKEDFAKSLITLEFLLITDRQRSVSALTSYPSFTEPYLASSVSVTLHSSAAYLTIWTQSGNNFVHFFFPEQNTFQWVTIQVNEFLFMHSTWPWIFVFSLIKSCSIQIISTKIFYRN